MANAPIGTNFAEGPLGVVLLNFDGQEIGKTMEDTTLEFVEDLKDILYAQDGTQPADKIPTGSAYKVTCQVAEITLQKLEKHIRGFTVAGSGNSAKLGRDLYRSGRLNFAKVLTMTRVDSDGNASSDARHKLNFYNALPEVNGPVGVYGPETQRTYELTFYIFFDETNEAFGYSGFASSNGVAAVA